MRKIFFFYFLNCVNKICENISKDRSVSNFINKHEFKFKLRSNPENMIFIWDQKRLKDQILELILQRNMKKVKIILLLFYKE